MSWIRTNGSARMTTLAVVVALAFGALALAGCGGVKESPGGPQGTGAIESEKAVAAGVRSEVLGALKAAGVRYTESFVTVVAGASADEFKVAGPMTLKSGEKVEELVVVKDGGKLVIK